MKTRTIRIPENLKIILNEQDENTGLTVQFNPTLVLLFKRHTEKLTTGEDQFGFQIINPTNTDRSEFTWGLNEKQCSKIINKIIKKPGFGFGKSRENLEEYIKKLINTIKTKCQNTTN